MSQNAEKTLGNNPDSPVEQNVSDFVMYGDAHKWELLCKGSSQKEGWMKSTKIMFVAGGAFLQVTTQQKNPDHSYEIAESVCFAPGVKRENFMNHKGVVPERIELGNE